MTKSPELTDICNVSSCTLGTDPEAQKEYAILARTDQPQHPVLTALGGPEWFDSPKDTYKLQQRYRKRCTGCGLREMQKELLRCSGCERTYFCSKKCQRESWRSHKSGCERIREELNKIESVQQVDPLKAQQARDWMARSTMPNTTEAYINALGLHRDPSRAFTHIVLSRLEYIPSATVTDPRDRFQVVVCGVFRIVDVKKEIRALVGADPGEILRTNEGIRDDTTDAFDRDRVPLPLVSIEYGKGIPPRFSRHLIEFMALCGCEYNPEWRKLLNCTCPPGSLKLKSGAKDVEYDFSDSVVPLDL
ncbi:hypothetical protein WOLCODRAFT_141442 [Wolfiporia cocos MD-104 SS10]|uniref:MYND-type domain-containing protein n=1 Tax=Wolfiporia cocos (strain MD-104) TaxID=742152 RepID=A0A2H3IU83_WOLCO|nr:hypothetical protein WOLCODRAFT_141442 [Wolfiporia cocos MD-104 SS10]